MCEKSRVSVSDKNRLPRGKDRNGHKKEIKKVHPLSPQDVAKEKEIEVVRGKIQCPRGRKHNKGY